MGPGLVEFDFLASDKLCVHIYAGDPHKVEC
jgi:hypothetical protein